MSSAQAVCVSQRRVGTLVQPAMKRRLPRHAVSFGDSNAASRWVSPGLATPFRAVTKSRLVEVRCDRNRMDNNTREGREQAAPHNS